MQDEGYTLSAAVERTAALMAEANGIRNFLLDAYHGIAVVDNQDMLDLGFLDAEHTQRLYARSRDHHVDYLVRPAGEEATGR